MARQASKGKCRLCGKSLSKAGMTKHLAVCRESHALEKPDGQGKSRATRLFHLVVDSGPLFWLQLEAPADATLRDLDRFLRDIWLECCGHLSAFTINGLRYDVDAAAARESGDSDVRSMNASLSQVIQPGMKFEHEYDFGTTTELDLKVAAEWEGRAKGKSIQILAGNDPPAIACGVCGQPATQMCSECIWSGGGFLCDECTGEHECGEEMLMPVVNSPRMGMCGYTGPGYIP
jgi:hypothetical protein